MGGPVQTDGPGRAVAATATPLPPDAQSATTLNRWARFAAGLEHWVSGQAGA
ncbi:Uncharacterised protein [Mycobacteroides abscessus subsp. massiliense]|nr:Uncharacterised protein [Mycobacteroides abscessus subsp. massiliense]SKT53191.1 Uncharacterised protein [Mycobacteroides abscessus subsp. massiliense]